MVSIVHVKEVGKMEEPLFIVRLYDGFDNEWIDISKPVSREEAEEILDKETKGGTEKTSFENIDYFCIFPADTVMGLSEAGRRLRASKRHA